VEREEKKDYEVSSSFTTLLTKPPSALPFTFGIKAPITFPMSCIDVASVWAIACSTNKEQSLLER